MPQTEKSPEKLRVVGGTDVPLEVVATKVQPYPSGTEQVNKIVLRLFAPTEKAFELHPKLAESLAIDILTGLGVAACRRVLREGA